MSYCLCTNVEVFDWLALVCTRYVKRVRGGGFAGDGVEILHDALQVPHLIVQLLRTVRVGRQHRLVETITRSLWMKNVRGPDLPHGGEVAMAGLL